MAITGHFSQELKFLISVASGQLDDDTLKQYAEQSSQEFAITDLRELGDMRKLDGMKALSVNGVLTSAQLQISREQSRLALLLSDNKLLYGLARVFQTVSDEKRGDVKIFTDLREALEWLSDDQTDFEKLKHFTDEQLN